MERFWIIQTLFIPLLHQVLFIAHIYHLPALPAIIQLLRQRLFHKLCKATKAVSLHRWDIIVAINLYLKIERACQLAENHFMVKRYTPFN